MSTWEDLTALCEMGQEAEDAEILEELKTEFAALETQVEEVRMTTLLSGEYDANNVILQLHSGAGGTEAQDWCQMLYRMYTRWAERHGFAWKTLDYEDVRRGGHQIRRHLHRGGKRLRSAEKRARRAPAGAGLSL